MKKYFLFLLVVLSFFSCKNTTKEAWNYLSRAYYKIASGDYQGSLLIVDSVHLLFPKQIEVRARALQLNDSIKYLQSLRTLHYTDSLLALLTARIDTLLPEFRYEKNEKHEDYGKYIHKRLYSTFRYYPYSLYAHVLDYGEVVVKFYYTGEQKLNIQSVRFASGEEDFVEYHGHNHRFEVDGVWHEILTFNKEASLQILQYISQHDTEPIKMYFRADSKANTRLRTEQREELERTYQLSLFMQDIKRLEHQTTICHTIIERYHQRR